MNGVKEKLDLLQKSVAEAAEQSKTRYQLQQKQANNATLGGKDLQAKLDLLEQDELPVKLGKLITGLELQKRFLTMGMHVRSFSDARQVLKYLLLLMEERIHAVGTVGSFMLIDDLTWIFNAASDILGTVMEIQE